MVRTPVYMDYHSTTPCDPRVVDAMLPFFSHHYGNASSKGHFFGWQAAEAVRIAREEVAALIHSEPGEIVFTSGATESINLSLKGIYEMFSSRGKHLITVATEHRAVLDTVAHLEKMGAEVSILPVKSDGLIDTAELESAIRPDIQLISVMYANNETGVIQPVGEIGRIAKDHGVLFFCDATQALGKVPVDVMEDGIDLMAGSAHKFYGPKGAGFLYVRRKNPRVRLIAQQDGGGQEKELRSGTLNVPGIVGLGRAAALAGTEMMKTMEKIRALRDRLETAILDSGEARLNGHADLRLPTVSNLSFGSAGRGLLEKLQKDVAVSSGSACNSASLEPSHVLRAMGLGDDQAYHSIRFSLGKFNTEDDIDFVLERVKENLRSENLKT